MKRPIPVFLLSLLGLAAGLGGTVQAQAPAEAPEVLLIACPDPEADRWKALDPSIRVDPLRGAENDLRMMADLVRFRHRCRPPAIRIVGAPSSELLREFDLCPQPPTHAVVTRELAAFAERLRPGRRGLVYFTGHGGRVEDPGTRSTGRLEFYVLRDGPLFDFEFDRLLSRAGGEVVLVADACYGPDLARGARVGQGKFLRFLGSRRTATLREMMRQRKKLLGIPVDRPLVLPPDGRRVLISAVTPNDKEEALVVPVVTAGPNTYASALTLALYRSLIRSGPRSYAQLKGDLERQLAALGVDQSPQILGAGAGRQPVLTPPATVEGRYPVAGARLGVGRFCGIQAGCELAGPGGERLRVSRAGAFEADLTENGRPAGVRGAARLVRSAADPVRVGTTYQRKNVIVRAGPEQESGRAPEPDPTGSGTTAISQAPGRPGCVQLFQHTPAGVFGPVAEVPEGEAPAEARRLAAALGACEAVFHTVSTLALDQAATADLRLATDRGTFFPRYRIGDRLSLTPTTSRSGYLLLLALDPDGSIAVLYPNRPERQVQQYRLPRDRPFLLDVTEPPGLTTLCALVSRAPIALPLDLLEQRPGMASFVVPPARVPGFTAWLQRELAGEAANEAEPSLEVALLQFVTER